MSDGAPAGSWSRRARTLSQLGVIVVVVWLIFIGTFYLNGGVYSELAGVEFNVSMFGLLFALTFLFLNRSRASLVCTVITLLDWPGSRSPEAPRFPAGSGSTGSSPRTDASVQD